MAGLGRVRRGRRIWSLLPFFQAALLGGVALAFGDRAVIEACIVCGRRGRAVPRPGQTALANKFLTAEELARPGADVPARRGLLPGLLATYS